MGTRKPDWAQRAVEKLLKDCTALPETNGWIAIKRHDLESLLRAHHRRVKRMVRKTGADRMIRSYYTIAYKDACRDILAELKEMER